LQSKSDEFVTAVTLFVSLNVNQGSMGYDWLELVKKLQSIAYAGLAYSPDPYDQERFQQLVQISNDIMANHSNLSAGRLESLYASESGYLTPKVDVRALVFRNDALLFVRESIDGKWSLPGGWADVGLTAAEVAAKEVEEEAGLRVSVTRLLAVLDKKCHPHPEDIYHVYKMFFLCEEEGVAEKSDLETSDVAFFNIDSLPDLSLGRNTKSQILMLYNQVRSGNQQAIFD
jgi:ADP-ribose pyrophosphatase YjhB (NUDIX family)